MNILERFIGAISPSWMLKRLRNFAAAAIIGRFYDGAANGRRTKNWRTQSTSANTEVQFGIVELRNRSRDLVRNNPYARKALRVLGSNTVGTGITPMIRVRSESAQKKLRAFWKKWAESTKCDFDERKTLAKMQSLGFKSMNESGEVFFRKVYSKEYGLQIQMLEADHLDHTKDGFENETGIVRQGIQFDKQGRRIGYWIFENHPGDNRISMKLTSTMIPAKDIIHLYNEERPGQLRGIPMGTASMLRIRDFDDYEDAQLVRQKIAACFSVFITSETHGSGLVNDDGDVTERIEPGMIERLKPGEQVQFGTPPTSEGYADYTRKVLQGVAAGYDVTYEALTGDLTGVNFSSGRMGHIEFQRLVEEYQELLLIPVLCSKIWDWFLDYAIIMGIIRKKEDVVCTWTAPRREFVDPLKEIKALIEQVRAGLISWQEAVRLLGYDPEEIMQQLIDDAKKFDEAGLMPLSDPRFDATRQNMDQSQPDKAKKDAVRPIAKAS
jgi:lambda family phage portal protein